MIVPALEPHWTIHVKTWDGTILDKDLLRSALIFDIGKEVYR
jgi:hypothetical protein